MRERGVFSQLLESEGYMLFCSMLYTVLFNSFSSFFLSFFLPLLLLDSQTQTERERADEYGGELAIAPPHPFHQRNLPKHSDSGSFLIIPPSPPRPFASVVLIHSYEEIFLCFPPPPPPLPFFHVSVPSLSEKRW